MDENLLYNIFQIFVKKFFPMIKKIGAVLWDWLRVHIK